MRRLLLVIEFLIGLAFIALIAVPLFESVEFLNDFNGTVETFKVENFDLYKYLVYGLGILFVVLFIVLMILPSRRKGAKAPKLKEDARKPAPVAAPAAEPESAGAFLDAETAAAYQYAPQYAPPPKEQEWPDEAFRLSPVPVPAPVQQFEPEPYAASVVATATVEESKNIYTDPRYAETREEVVVPDRTVKPASISQPWAKEAKPKTTRQRKPAAEKPAAAPKPAPKPKAEPKPAQVSRSARQPEPAGHGGYDDGKPPFKLD
ncbi:MAG: hypothetical protein LBL66_08490 [Clostridiales bacterium]|jgi:hypothetical protein|nr:hypothetical protein [Clostridiales bacterium]